MPFLANALLTTARPAFTTATLATGGSVPYLKDVVCHIGGNTASAYRPLPDAALASPYKAIVDSGTDISAGDTITAITLLDGVTPWPGDFPPTGDAPGQDPTSLWMVVYHKESSPAFLPHRTLYLDRFTGQGPTHP